MKNLKAIVLLLVLITGIPLIAFSGNGPADPAGKGNGILGFGFGPAIPFYGGEGFGPAFMVHYDHGIWQAGPGTISLGGQIGTSFFWHNYSHKEVQYRDNWTNLAFVFRGAYHYGWKVPGLDTYAGFGGGTLVSMYNDGGYYPDKQPTHVSYLPTAFMGASYFFNDVVGVNAECGYNFAFISIGLNFRLTR
ncbi:MAG: hypothetical protein NT040_13305 [Bacteroidetes bacterium]|nr:hypothetical protein [Bacteroidota bacterium]